MGRKRSEGGVRGRGGEGESGTWGGGGDSKGESGMCRWEEMREEARQGQRVGVGTEMEMARARGGGCDL